MTDNVARVIAILGALILVGGGLWRRGLDGHRAGKLAVIWIGIIALAWGAVTVIQHFMSQP